jgi:methylmalonyl-CoA epimerase
VRTGAEDQPRLELVEPVDPEGGVARFLADRGEGVHHVCLTSDNLPADLAALAVAEAELIDIQPRPGAHGQVAFVHPRTLNGVLWELVQRSDEGEP